MPGLTEARLVFRPAVQQLLALCLLEAGDGDLGTASRKVSDLANVLTGAIPAKTMRAVIILAVASILCRGIAEAEAISPVLWTQLRGAAEGESN